MFSDNRILRSASERRIRLDEDIHSIGKAFINCAILKIFEKFASEVNILNKYINLNY